MQHLRQFLRPRRSTLFAFLLASVLLFASITSTVHAASRLVPLPTTASPAVTAAGPIADIDALTVGRDHTCALTSSGGVKCWGRNNEGQLGDDTTLDSALPVTVVGLTSGVAAISAGHLHTCALTTSGGVKCWGANDYGQLGDGTTTNRTTPVDVSGLTTGVRAISSGGTSTCALTTANGVKCWGENFYGQLGDGTTDDSTAPVDVSGLTAGVAAISVGGGHACALTDSGGVKCWGWNDKGQLGDNTHIGRTQPVDVAGLASAVAKVSAGSQHTCAVTTSGGVKCWGRNFEGQLGDGSKTDSSTPIDVSGLGSGISDLNAGHFHNCALTDGGGVKCWGWNDKGQLGDGTTTDRTTPVDVDGLSSGIADVRAGDSHSCALTTAGNMKCWGDNGDGQLGNDTTTNSTTPTDVLMGVDSLASIKTVGAGGSHTCATTKAGGVQCWGGNLRGQLGDGTTISRTLPVNVTDLSSGVAAVSAGGSHTCALTTTGGIKCWGNNASGRVGDGTDALTRTTPVNVVGLSSGATRGQCRRIPYVRVDHRWRRQVLGQQRLWSTWHRNHHQDEYAR